MHNNFSKCFLIKFEPADKIDENVMDFLDNYFPVSALNYTDDGKEEYVGYAQSDFDKDDLWIKSKQAGINLPMFRTEELENKNWLTENVIKFNPIETSDFCIYGVHEKQAPATQKHLLKIYAATAFGSGGHQTTKCCLEALSALKDKKVKNFLDIGTGSGILALAGATLWMAENPQIVAVDIDYEAVRVATQNAFDNHLEQFLQIAQSDGYDSELVQDHAPYDLITANILARPLIDMAPQMAKNLHKGGFGIISGFIENQVDWVVKAHQDQGLSVLKTFNIDNWYAVLLEKK